MRFCQPNTPDSGLLSRLLSYFAVDPPLNDLHQTQDKRSLRSFYGIVRLLAYLSSRRDAFLGVRDFAGLDLLPIKDAGVESKHRVSFTLLCLASENKHDAVV